MAQDVNKRIERGQIMNYDTITKAQERCLEKRLNKNISLKKLNLWFESLENTFKNNTDILNFIKMLKLMEV